MPAKKLVVSTYLQYIALAVLVLLLFSLVQQISGVLLTFLAAAVLAYALNPIVRFLERRRVPRVVAVVGLFLVLFLVVSATLLVIIVPAVGQIREIVSNPQQIAGQADALTQQAQNLPFVGQYVTDLDQDRILQLLRSNAPSAGQVANVATGVIGGVFGVFGAIFNLLLMVLVSIYLLLEREKITRALLRTIPGTIRDQSLELFHAVEKTLIQYLRGQLFLCAIMGVLGWAIMFFTVREYALLVGAWVAATEIIPVLGAFLGAIPGVLIALFFGGFTDALIVAGLFLVAQQIEGNILVPRIQGGSTGVHPLWVLFGTLAGTALYGIIGAIFAVPIVAIIAATIRYLRNTLAFERWSRPPLQPEEPPRTEAESLPEAAGLGRTRREEEREDGQT
ncbi:AI-2E family transporter [Rubrobacter tropicus]|uniref:AI-2E family transporter n=1 Tax=Rubrobacter tropicus TaxID=2653851 RepID=A0A6G8QC87_9ACTN|nr:AI-2E family transporter [Rubrobacter tropicus]QIN84124.1 AI-2E family transporter [Rubrobacter tropicus]